MSKKDRYCLFFGRFILSHPDIYKVHVYKKANGQFADIDIRYTGYNPHSKAQPIKKPATNVAKSSKDIDKHVKHDQSLLNRILRKL